ncbi:thioredoxin [Gorillibacterium massiliense]|uniref:thioredoxin n=1 Tax=Gorillibacterium massiliense TaxID=1280390 RepID=UPI0005952E0A|nr:thioredoxin [Gorillibacterium massiliense]
MAIVNVTDRTFEQDVLRANKPVLVDFWAPWCGPCRMIAPELERLSQELGDTVTIAKVNVDENPMLPSIYKVQGIPTLKLFAGGKDVETVVGLRPGSYLKQMIQKYI